MKRILTQEKPMNGKWMNHNHQGMGWVICMSIFQIYMTSLVTILVVTTDSTLTNLVMWLMILVMIVMMVRRF